MKRKIIPIVLLICFGRIAFSQSWTPGNAEIANLEASIKLDQLPYWKISNLPSLSGYDRYYTGSTQNGEKVIFGELVVPFDAKSKPGVHIVARKRDFPVIMDGGCAIINIEYSLKEQRIVRIECNGRA